MQEKNRFALLKGKNVESHIEKKNGLRYLAWAFAWDEFKSEFPESFYTIYENENSWNYFTDGRTCWVKTGVTLVDSDYRLEHIEYLPIMDLRNTSIPKDKITSFDVNKAIQRSLTKAVARHGLGLYVYAGEDLPEEEKEKKEQLSAAKKEAVDLCKAKVGAGVDRSAVEEIVKKHNNGNANPNSIEDLSIAKAICTELKKLKAAK